jgi:hypothetical protein
VKLDATSFAAPGVAGDYNSNGRVDAADYVLWRNNNNTVTTLPNDSTPARDHSDYPYGGPTSP